MGKYRIGIDVGGTKIAYGLYGGDHALLASQIRPSRPELESRDMLKAMCADIAVLLENAGLPLSALSGVGAAFPGHIDYARGLVITASNLPGWKSVPARDILEQALGTPVAVDNDANAAALAESRLGAGQGHENMVYLTISTGLGAGLILNGALFRGSYGAAGGMGHVFMESGSRIVCGCGRMGCAEAVASGTGLSRMAKIRLCEGMPSILPELSGGFERISPYYIGQAAQQGDALALEVLDAFAENLSKVFYNVYQIFNCSCLVYGGGVSKLGPLLMDRVEEGFLRRIPLAKEYPMAILPARFGDEAGMAGASLLTD